MVADFDNFTPGKMRTLMEYLVPALAILGFISLWIFVLPKLKGGG